jgi:hypothetical protein
MLNDGAVCEVSTDPFGPILFVCITHVYVCIVVRLCTNLNLYLAS